MKLCCSISCFSRVRLSMGQGVVGGCAETSPFFCRKGVVMGIFLWLFQFGYPSAFSTFHYLCLEPACKKELHPCPILQLKLYAIHSGYQEKELQSRAGTFSQDCEFSLLRLKGMWMDGCAFPAGGIVVRESPVFLFWKMLFMGRMVLWWSNFNDGAYLNRKTYLLYSFISFHFGRIH